MKTAAGLVLALVSAALLNGGFYMQHGAARDLPRLSLRRPLHGLRLLFFEWRWLAGWVAGWAGWGVYIAALALAPLSLVQAVSAGGVGVIALMAWRFGKTTLSRHEVAGVVTCLAGIGLIFFSLVGHVPAQHKPSAASVAYWMVGCVVAAALAVVVGSGRTGRHIAGGAGLGAAAGLMYAAGDIATKGALAKSSLLFVPALLVCHLLGFVAMQLSFQRGRALATAGLATLLDSTLPIIAGVVVFAEGIPPNVFGVVRVLGFAGAVAGAVLLAHRSEEVGEKRAGGLDAAAPAA